MNANLEFLQSWAGEVDEDGNGDCARLLLGRIERGELTPDSAVALFYILTPESEHAAPEGW